MKKLRFLPLLLLMLLCLYATASAADMPGQQSIAYITGANGDVPDLLDNRTDTAWIKTSDGGVDLTLTMYYSTVGEIWIRNGYAYNSSYYNHYDRPVQMKVTVYYYVNQYTESYDTYRYTLSDAYRPTTNARGWNDGYQRLLLPRQYKNVTRIELTVESVSLGYGRTGAAITDIIVTSGSHATATPKSYATATPRTPVVAISPSPGPWVEEDDEPLVEFITPRPTKTPGVTLITPKPTATPLVQVITPKPTATVEPIEYPSIGGVIGYTTQKMATRSGPSQDFDEPGSFFSAGQEVKVISKVWDDNNELYWLQVEFEYRNQWYRAYTTDTRVDVNLSLVPEEPEYGDPLDNRTILFSCKASFGPGEEYAVFTPGTLHEGNRCDVYAIEDGWVQIEYTDFGSMAVPQPKRRGWVPVEALYNDD